MTATELLELTYRLAASTIRPEPVAFYKPLPSGDGRAAKLNLRLAPTYKGDLEKYYVEDVEGGLFIDIAPQGGANDAGNAVFKWTDPSKVTAKLGMADLSALLVGQAEYRKTGQVPEGLRGKDKSKTDVISLFHKTPGGGSTSIAMQLSPTGMSLRLAKSKEHFQSIRLNLQEELILVRFLTLSLDAFIKLGVV